MTCWKTINLSKDYGFHRIALISLITMFFAFILFYLPLNLMFSKIHLHEDGLWLFSIALIFVFPFHKVLHAFPLWMTGKRVKLNFKRLFLFIPVLSTRCQYSLSKRMTMIVLLTPFITITSTMLIACFLFPAYIHYFTIIAAVNLGFCVTDFICLNQFMKAPKACIIEEIEEGYEILIEN
ncbi:DUF3267 domain-containing protein [Bacillus timonensis]|nr:DUF3267 domain-containing protein [Bacillus timonensis]